MHFGYLSRESVIRSHQRMWPENYRLVNLSTGLTFPSRRVKGDANMQKCISNTCPGCFECQRNKLLACCWPQIYDAIMTVRKKIASSNSQHQHRWAGFRRSARQGRKSCDNNLSIFSYRRRSNLLRTDRLGINNDSNGVDGDHGFVKLIEV